MLTDTAYRKLDVDAFDPDKFGDAEADEQAGEIQTDVTGPDEVTVRQLLQSNRNVEALKAALLNPPLETKNQTLKEKAAQLVVRVLTSFKNAEIESAIKTLSADEVDLLMKYIYKGMELQQDGQTCASLLAWHAQAFQLCGQGGIVRIFTDRNRL